MFLNVRDASMRLSSSLIRKGDEPIWVGDVEDKDTFVYFIIGKGEKWLRGKLSSGEFNLKAMPLGYVNYKGTAAYLSRKPTRRWKQGLNGDNVHLRASTGIPFRWSSLIKSNGMVDTVAGVYPNIESVWDSVETNGATSRAFSRKWAVVHRDHGRDCKEGSHVLEYKGHVVGCISSPQGAYDLKEKFQYLKESLEEALDENGM